MKNFVLISCLLSAVGFWACSSKSSDGPVAPSVVVEYSVPLSTQYEVPEVSPDRTETGTAILRLMSDNTLQFSITVNGLNPNDTLTFAHIHESPTLVEAGPVILGLVDDVDVKFKNGFAADTIKISGADAASVIGKLKTSKKLYINVHSAKFKPGLVRGNIGVTMDLAQNVFLAAANHRPPVAGRRETGVGMLRVVGNELFYFLKVNLDKSKNDALTVAHIHKVSPNSQTGPVFIGLVDNQAQKFSVNPTTNVATFGPARVALTASDKATLIGSEPLYINVHSNMVPAGLLRGDLVR